VAELIIKRNYGLADTGNLRLFAVREDRAKKPENDGELSPEEADSEAGI